MIQQVFRCLWGPVLFQIVRRGADQSVIGGERSGDLCRVVEAADADAEIHAFLYQIDEAFGELKADLHLRESVGEFGDIGGYMALAEGGGHGDFEHAARGLTLFCQRILDDLHLFQNTHAMFVVELAFLGHMDLAGGAVQQAYAEPFFQFADAVADNGGRHAQVAARRR